MALGTLKYLKENKLTPGKDIGVIGFDNIGIAGLSQINLTTIKQPKYSTGRILTKALLDEINTQHDGNRNSPQRILLQPELIIRDTTSKQ